MRRRIRRNSIIPVNTLGDLPRGVEGMKDAPRASLRHFPTADTLAADPQLRFDPRRANGKIFLGAIGAGIETRELPSGRIEHAAVGGTLIGLNDDRHVWTTAGTRSGKGRALLINNLLTYSGSAIIIDPKGDLALETALHRHSPMGLGQRVHVLDPFNATCGAVSEFVTRFNPLQHVDRDDVDALARSCSLIADALVVPSPGEKDPHWSDTAKQFLEALIAFVLTSERYQGRRTLGSVYWAAAMEVEDDAFAQEMGESTAAGGLVAAGAMALYAKDEKERSGVLSTLRRHLHFLRLEKIRAALEDGPFDLADLQREKMTLYISLPAMDMGSCAGYLRMFINLALNALEANTNRRDFQLQEGGAPVLMLIDEAVILSRLKRLEEALGLMGGMGVKIWSVWQDLAQAADTYGRRWESMMGSASVQTFFGLNDQFSLDYAAKRLGETLVQSPSQQSVSVDNAIGQGDLGRSIAWQSHPLLSTAEIASLFDRDDPMQRQLVILPRYGPVILQKAFADRHDAFRSFHVRG